MAESSSAVASTSTASNSSYDVFINHRGSDVKKTFASHLYRRLLSYGLRVFLDQPELQRGDCFTPQIEDAIGSASVHVAIFSAGYADSKWCLNELLLMLKSKAPIIPVFYGVKPDELRWTRGQKGSYVEALEKLKRKTEYGSQTPRYEPSTIEKWRNALSNVADICGFELEACNGDEGELLDKVVKSLLKKVKKPALALDVAKYPTGLDDKVKDFENSVLLPQQQRGKPHIFGIVGLGGVGKTTLAKEFFNRNISKYHTSCFLFDVRDYASKGSLISLQIKVLKSLRLTESDSPVNNVDEGIRMLRMHLPSAKALVIIDDVDHVDQVDALWPHQTVLHSDSLILITSRNKHVLINSRVGESSIYNLTGLTPQHSLDLFCLHSFNQSYPPPEFESLVNKFLETCGGLPLSLKVIGALLNGKDTSYWEDQLNRLGRILPNEIKQKLQISYDALEREEKQIFLDIACFFIGEDRDMAVRIWENGLCGFRNIQDRCLVEVNSENKIKMHDHLRDMGREIAQASGLPRRLWSWTRNDMEDLLQKSSTEQVINEVRGIRMLDHTDSDSDDNSSEMPWYERISEVFGNCLTKLCNMPRNTQYPFHGTGICMSNLQLLDTKDVLLERILTKVQFPHLMWLRWNNCPYSSLPSWISMKNLRVLQVQGKKLKTLWENESQAPSQLRDLSINAPLKKIPKSIGQLKHLERIEIRYVIHSVAPNDSHFASISDPHSVPLTKFPAEFCLLQSLKSLVLEECTKMKSLPECFGNLTNLHHIGLIGCYALERLPECFGNLTNLHHISLNECSALERLPDSFCRLIKLQSLRLAGCTNLTMSNETLGNISTLECIELNECEKIEVLPQQVARQMSLEQLFLEETNLKELPSTIGELSVLEHLSVGSPFLDTLPPSLCDLRNLKQLHLVGCWGLKCLPASLGLLTQLIELVVDGCPLISELPFKMAVKGDRETLSDLNSSIHNCTFPRLQNLRVGRTGISEVSFAQGVCFNLRSLSIQWCNNLVEVGTWPNTLLNLISIWSCHNLRKIGNTDGLAELRLLDVKGCSKLEELPGIETLVYLRWLRASGCVKLKSIRGLRQLTELQAVVMEGCSDLEEVEGIQHCMSLKELDVTGCPKLRWSAGVVEQLRQRSALKLIGV